MTVALPASRRRLIAAGLVLMITGLWTSVGGPAARADVTSTSGSAFGVRVTSSILGTVVPAQPAVMGASPPINYGPFAQTLLDLHLPGLLRAQNVNVQTFGALGPNPHLNAANSLASIERASVGPDTLVLNAITTTCSADGNGGTGTTNLASGTLGGNPLLSGLIAPNTRVMLDGVLDIVLNEQIVPDPPVAGSASITVNGAHVRVLTSDIPGVPAGLDVVLASVTCAVAGPDVLTSTTSTTLDPGTTTTSTTSTTSTTLDPGTTTTSTTSTTLDPGTTTTSTTSTTLDPGTTTTSTTSTTLDPGTTTTSTTTLASTSTTQAGGTPLVRTGTDAQRGTVVAFAFVLLGAVLLSMGTMDSARYPALARRMSSFASRRHTTGRSRRRF